MVSSIGLVILESMDVAQVFLLERQVVVVVQLLTCYVFSTVNMREV